MFNPWETSPQHAIEALQRGEIDADTLIRALLGWADWRVAGREADAGGLELGVLHPCSGRLLTLYSGDDAVARAAAEDEGFGLTESLVPVPGWGLFKVLPEGALDAVQIDPGNPWSIRWEREQVELLRSWAPIVEAELAVLDRIPGALVVLQRYEGYRIVEDTASGGPNLVLAPDLADRNLAAVFTAHDTAEAFLHRARADVGRGCEIRTVAGRELFPRLLRERLHGFVVNPLTHLPARAFSSGILPHLAPGARPEPAKA